MDEMPDRRPGAGDPRRGPMIVCGIDPGIVNMSFWVGSLDLERRVVSTLIMDKGPIGQTVAVGGEKCKRQSVQAASADAAMRIADECVSNGVECVVVETAPQWNTPIRISAATLYGVLRGRGIGNVRFSSPTTKSSAMISFAGQLGIELEKPPDGVDKLDKRSSAKIRLINKRNAIEIVDALLKRSADAVGIERFGSDPNKRDDMADALLLGCGAGMALDKEQSAELKRAVRAQKKIVSDAAKAKIAERRRLRSIAVHRDDMVVSDPPRPDDDKIKKI
jgi:hypothetical protein